MVSAASLTAMFFTLLLSLLLPIALVICLYRRYHFSLKATLLGVGVFVLFQLILRLSLLNFLSAQPWFRHLSTSFLFSAVIIGGLSAGLFEECGRYLAFRTLLRDELSWGNGLAYGLGHGGVEAVALVGFGYINNIYLSLMINWGAFEQIAPELGPYASQIRAQLIGLPPAVFLAAGVERALVLPVQIALSLVVLGAVKQRRPLLLLGAVLLHGGINAGALYLQGRGAAVWLIELYLAVLAAAAICLIVKTGQRSMGEAP